MSDHDKARASVRLDGETQFVMTDYEVVRQQLMKAEWPHGGHGTLDGALAALACIEAKNEWLREEAWNVVGWWESEDCPHAHGETGAAVRGLCTALEESKAYPGGER